MSAPCRHDVLRWDYHEEETSCSACGLSAQTIVNELTAERDKYRGVLETLAGPRFCSGDGMADFARDALKP